MLPYDGVVVGGGRVVAMIDFTLDVVIDRFLSSGDIWLATVRFFVSLDRSSASLQYQIPYQC